MNEDSLEFVMEMSLCAMNEPGVDQDHEEGGCAAAQDQMYRRDRMGNLSGHVYSES